MRGRKPLPTEIKLMRGNPGRRPLNPNEPKHPPLDPTVPADLTSEDAKTEWTRIVGTLAKGHVTTVDRATLVGYCTYYAQWLEFKREAAKHPHIVKSPSGYPIPNPLQGMANKAYSLMLRTASELGITPSARARIAVAPDVEDETDEFTMYQRKRRQGA